MAARTARVHLKPGTGAIEVDGTDLSHAVHGVTVKADVLSVPCMTLDLVLHDMGVDGEMRVVVPDATAGALVALGWTPPSVEQPPG